MFGRKKKKAKGGDGGKKHKEVGSKVEIEGFTVTIDKELAEGVHFPVLFSDIYANGSFHFCWLGHHTPRAVDPGINSRSGERTPIRGVLADSLTSCRPGDRRRLEGCGSVQLLGVEREFVLLIISLASVGWCRCRVAGGFAVVFLAHDSSGKAYALKKVSVSLS